jgi:hypothetical protein
MWRIETTTSWEKDHKHYNKKHDSELAAVLRNLQRYLVLLNASQNSKCVQAGYLHNEPGGVVAIDQKGLAANLQETRMYTFADDQKKIIYLLKIGNKDSQHSDIEYCKGFGGQISEQSGISEDIATVK